MLPVNTQKHCISNSLKYHASPHFLYCSIDIITLLSDTPLGVTVSIKKEDLSKARCRVIINNSTKEKIVMGEIITKTNKEVLQFFDEMKRISTFIDALKSGYTPSLNGERFLTDTELSEMLKLTKRTLLEYRNCGKIPYYQIGGKILYRENDIEKLLYENRRDTF